MKKDIILAGVGGQGLLSIAAVIGEAAVSQVCSSSRQRCMGWLSAAG